MVGPVIMASQSRPTGAFSPRILNGTDWWCSGLLRTRRRSDLASLTTARNAAKRVFRQRQKTWNTLGHLADWIFCLVRTDSEARPQAGISFLLIDMRTPGITVRPIPLIDGEHEVNEIWFDNVEVPMPTFIGEENKGWTYAKYLLTHERVNIAQVGQARRELKRLQQLAARQLEGGQRLLDNVRFRHRLAEVEIDLMALELTVMRVLSAEKKRRDPAGVFSPEDPRLRDPTSPVGAQHAGAAATMRCRDSHGPGCGLARLAGGRGSLGAAHGPVFQSTQNVNLQRLE